MANNNTIDMQSETLEDFAERYVNTAGNHVNPKSILKDGANWQKGKDKAVIESLIAGVKMFLNKEYMIWGNDAEWKQIEELKQLLNQLQKQNLL